MYQCPPHAQYQYFNYSLFIVLLYRDDMKIRRSRNEIWWTWCNFTVISMPSRSHISRFTETLNFSCHTLACNRCNSHGRGLHDYPVVYRRIILRLLARTCPTSRKKRKKESTRFLRRAAQKRDSRRIKRFIGIFMLQTITIVLLILYFITRLFFSLSSFVRNDHIRHCDLSRGNERKKNREKERACVCVCMYLQQSIGRTRVKMYDFNVRGVQEKGIEIRILFLYVKKCKN